MEQSLRWSKAPLRYSPYVVHRPSFSLNGAIQQARWLDELRTALDQASKLTTMLCDYADGGGDACMVRARILALGAEVEAIQRR